MIKPPKNILILVFSHLAAALPLAYFVNIWADEASTLYTTRNGFFYSLENAFSIEKQAPLYFWILSLWREIDDSVFFARLFSVICSGVAIIFFHRLTRKFFDENAAFFASAFFALHPYLFWASLEIRLYSLVILLSILILDLFWEIFLENERAQKGKDVFFIFVSIFALYTNYYLGFLLVGCFVALIVLRKWQAARKYFLQMLVVGAFFLPLLWAMKSQFAVNSGGFQTEKSFFEFWRLIWSYFLTFVLPTEIYPLQSEEISTISFFRLWLMRAAILAALVFLVKTRKFFDEKILAFGAISATIAGFFLLAYFLLGGMYIAVRHAAVLFVPVILLVSLILKEVIQEIYKKIADKNIFYKLNLFVPVFLAGLIAFFFAYSIYTLYPNLTKRGDWARVAEFLQANEKPDQPILIFPNYDALALPVYYKGANKILPDENFFRWNVEAEPGTAGSLKKQTEFIISEIPVEAKEIWLLTDESCEITERCRPLENFVEANYNIIESKMFYLEKLRLLRKK